MTQLSLQLIKETALKRGLSLFGLRRATPLEEDAPRLAAWQEAGYAGEMAYMNRDPSLLTDPRRLLPEAKWIVQFAVNYGSLPRPRLQPGTGRVARYAWGLDYHEVLRARLKALVTEWQGLVGEFKVRTFSDAVPLLERAVGEDAGLGFVGKNTLLIRPGTGSFFFLAEIITDAEILEVSGEKEPRFSGGGCSSCSLCLSSCPTSAFVAPYKLDARRCISYLTIEKRGVFTKEEAKMLGDWVFGCDICQEVCPFNHRAIKISKPGDLPEFDSQNGVGPALSLGEILTIHDDDTFKRRFAGSPLLRPGREGLIRNAAAVAANLVWEEGVQSLLVLATEDSSEIVRLSAVMALGEIGHVLGSKLQVLVKSKLGPTLENQPAKVREEIDRIFC